MYEEAKTENRVNDRRTLWILFKTCFEISACTFGGGMVIISLLQKKFVEELKWIDQEEVMDMVAIGQSSPGVMAVNVSIIIGYRIAGIKGALLTVLGTILPPTIILSVISKFYVQFRSNVVISLLLKGMQAGVVGVMINVTLTMMKNIVNEKMKYLVVMMVVASIAAVFFGVDTIVILAVCGICGGIIALGYAKKGGG